jgi:hypothetical protein
VPHTAVTGPQDHSPGASDFHLRGLPKAPFKGISYVRRALQLHYRLSPSHLARRFGVTRDTIHDYSNA